MVVRGSPCACRVTPDCGFSVDDHPALPGGMAVSVCSGLAQPSAMLGEALAQGVVEGRRGRDLGRFG